MKHLSRDKQDPEKHQIPRKQKTDHTKNPLQHKPKLIAKLPCSMKLHAGKKKPADCNINQPADDVPNSS